MPILLFNRHGDSFPGVKETRQEHHSLPSCVEVKNDCSYTSALPICHHDMTKENFPSHQFYPVTNAPPCSKSIFMLLQFMLYSADVSIKKITNLISASSSHLYHTITYICTSILQAQTYNIQIMSTWTETCILHSYTWISKHSKGKAVPVQVMKVSCRGNWRRIEKCLGSSPSRPYEPRP
jgi:hypothetical protein